MDTLIPVGARLPEIALFDQNHAGIRVADLAGRTVLLSFHPLAWTPVCSRQMKALDVHHDDFARAGALALGVSVDSVPSKHAWAKELAITRTSLLADFWPHGAVAQALGLFRSSDGFSERANIIVNRDQRVAWVKVYPISELPDIAEVLRALGA